MENRYFYHWINFTIVLAAIVIIVGAYTRLTDAGLGCPDWPGCYGQLIITTGGEQLQAANAGTDVKKAATEMIHRYLAGSLGLAILIIFLTTLVRWSRNQGGKRQTPDPLLLPTLLVLFVTLQALLGMWTVTWKLLPLVVLAHLLGGFTIFACLWRLKLNYGRQQQSIKTTKNYKPWLLLGLIILGMQIALGGWVSANYAGVACTGFPQCNGQLLPKMNFSEAFSSASPIGPNYEGGHLNNNARVTIQMMHRIGALITLSYLGPLLVSMWLYAKAQRYTILLAFIVLCAQIALGVINVLAYLPLSVAVAHNGFALILFSALLTLLYRQRTTLVEKNSDQ